MPHADTHCRCSSIDASACWMFRGEKGGCRCRCHKLHEAVSLLREVEKLDDGDEPFAWKHQELFTQIHEYLGR